MLPCRCLPALESALQGSEIIIEKDLENKISQLCARIARKASPDLRMAVEKIREDFENRPAVARTQAREVTIGRQMITFSFQTRERPSLCSSAVRSALARHQTHGQGARHSGCTALRCALFCLATLMCQTGSHR